MKDGTWKNVSSKYLVCDKVLSGIFRDKFREQLKAVNLFHATTHKAWSEKFVTDVEANGSGENGLRYLSRYISRTAISNRRIVGCENGMVTYLWKPKDEKEYRPKEMEAVKFLELFLEHVQPPGFQRVRHFGLLHSSSKPKRDELLELISAAADDKGKMSYRMKRLKKLIEEWGTVKKPVPICEKCSGPLLLVTMTYKRDPLGRDDHIQFTELTYRPEYRDTG